MKKIFKSIGLIALAVVVCLGALLIPFKSKQAVNTASADSTSVYYYYESSNFYMPLDGYTGSTVNFHGDGLGQIHLEKNNIIFRLKCWFPYDNNSWSYYVFNFGNSYFTNLDTTLSTISYFITNVGSIKINYYVNSLDFNYNVVSVRYYSEVISDNYARNCVSFIDNNANYFNLSFDCELGGSDRLLDDRYYYLLNDFTDNEFYIQGVSDGYSTGLTDGESIGYNKGFQAGETQGFNNGYVDGVESANTYSFLGLIGAVVDAPFSVFTDMFNFELLGVNMSNFFLSILTFCLIIVIVKFALGGK